MSTTQGLIAYGTYVSDGSPRTIELPADISYFEIVDRSGYGTHPAAVVKSMWHHGMNNGAAMQISEAAATGILSAPAQLTAGGVSLINWNTSIGAAVAMTAVTNANPAVASSASTAVVGDIVRVYGTTGMLQIAGMDFSVTAVNPGVTQSFGYLNAAGFGAAATAGNMRILPFDLQSYPRKRYITAITQAASAVMTMSVTHGYVVGQKVFISVPTGYGMTEMDGLTGEITAINTTTNTITVNINSSAFTAFAYPTSANASLYSKPHIVPAGEVATILTGAYRSSYSCGIKLGASVVGVAGHTMDWIAYRGESV